MIRRRKKGQAALEYLVTYGWSFLVIMLIVGALAYFGVINPNRWTTNRCDLGSQMECADYYINATPGNQKVMLFLRNNFGKNITITDGVIRDNTGNLIGGLQGGIPIVIDPGDSREVNITIPDTYTDGEKRRTTIHVEFQRARVGSAQHNITGLLYVEARAD